MANYFPYGEFRKPTRRPNLTIRDLVPGDVVLRLYDAYEAATARADAAQKRVAELEKVIREGGLRPSRDRDDDAPGRIFHVDGRWRDE